MRRLISRLRWHWHLSLLLLLPYSCIYLLLFRMINEWLYSGSICASIIKISQSCTLLSYSHRHWNISISTTRPWVYSYIPTRRPNLCLIILLFFLWYFDVMPILTINFLNFLLFFYHLCRLLNFRFFYFLMFLWILILFKFPLCNRISISNIFIWTLSCNIWWCFSRNNYIIINNQSILISINVNIILTFLCLSYTIIPM